VQKTEVLARRAMEKKQINLLCYHSEVMQIKIMTERYKNELIIVIRIMANRTIMIIKN
jgi:hypothetical protein